MNTKKRRPQTCKKKEKTQHMIAYFAEPARKNIPSCLLRCAVLYSYKPRQPEELELRKGEMVGVYGKFKEGWLRGLSLRTGKVGILPSNYISPVLRWEATIPAGTKWELDGIWISNQ